jgi:hypothetical protein
MPRKKTGRPRGRPRKAPKPPVMTVPTFETAPDPDELEAERAQDAETPAAPADAGAAPAFTEGAAAADEPAETPEEQAQREQLEEHAAKTIEKVVDGINAAAVEVPTDSLAYKSSEKLLALIDKKVLPVAFKKIPPFMGMKPRVPGVVDADTQKLVVKAGAVYGHTELGLSIEAMGPKKFLLFALALYVATAVAGSEVLLEEDTAAAAAKSA